MKYFKLFHTRYQSFPGGAGVKNLPTNAGDMGSIPGRGRSPGGGNGSPLQDSCLENPMDRGAWQAIVHGVSRVRRDWTAGHMPGHKSMNSQKIRHCNWRSTREQESPAFQQRGKRQAHQPPLRSCAWASGDRSRRLFPPSREREGPEEFQRALLKSPFVYSGCVTSPAPCPTGCEPCFWQELWPMFLHFRANQNFVLSLWASRVGGRAWDSPSRIPRQGRRRAGGPVAGSRQRGWPFSGDLSLSRLLQESLSGCWDVGDVGDVVMGTLVFVGWVSSLDGTGVWELLTHLQNCVCLSDLFPQWLRIWPEDNSHTTSVGVQEQGSRWALCSLSVTVCPGQPFLLASGKMGCGAREPQSEPRKVQYSYKQPSPSHLSA